jgi:3-methyl-2-oxobutanoate hydroxymethyltransferase
MLTAYDAGFARVLDASGIDLILIGDSLGMVVQGHDSTLPVTVADMVYHTAAVARAAAALLVADLPFGPMPRRSARWMHPRSCCGRCRDGQDRRCRHKLDTIRYLVEREIPVCAHLGLTRSRCCAWGLQDAGPRRCRRASWWPMPGRGRGRRQHHGARMRAHAFGGGDHRGRAGADHRHRRRPAVRWPGAGVARFPRLDSGHRRPKFVKDFLAEGGSVAGAVRAYVDAVHGGTFPDAEHSYA